MESKIKRLIDKNYSIPKMAKELNLSNSGVRYWLKKLKLKTNYKENKNKKWSEENLLKAINNGSCKSDVLRNLKMVINSGNFQTLDKYCRLYKINISHMKSNYNFSKNFNFSRRKDEDVYIENSTFTSTHHLKHRLLKSGILKNECSECDNKGEWMGKKLSLQLEHKNGIRNDNRIENLCILCPNCHSQTKTYSGKKKKKN